MIRKIFTGGTRRQQDRYSSHRGGNGTSSNAKKSQPKKKIIGKNEGEYVDYTEIK
jgi:hypothetical protein